MSKCSDPAAKSSMDVFEAARWFDTLWNSRAKAVSAEEIEWQCTTWGSGRGRCQFEDVALFRLIAHLFDLRTDRGDRDELIVRVEMRYADRIVALVRQLDDDAEYWPWLQHETREDRLTAAARVLGLEPEAIEADPELLEWLAIG